MQYVASKHPPGTIILPTQELSRYSDFWICMTRLQVPAHSSLMIARSGNVAQNLNNGIRNMVGEWIMCMGDDHTFKPDAVLKLLDDGVDYVSPLVCSRKTPHPALIFKSEVEGKPHVYNLMPWNEVPAYGTHEVCRTSGVALIRKHVLDALSDPWFVVGHGSPEVMGEDLYFQKRIIDKGFKVFVNVDVQFGHIGSNSIVPVKNEHGWGPAIDFGSDHYVDIR